MMTSAMKKDHTLVALLRGINVGGRNKLPMAELRSIASECGCGSPATYLQSGNLFLSTSKAPATVPTLLADAIKKRCGLEVPVIVRTPDAIQYLIDSNPYAKEAAEDPTKVLVTFLPEPASKILQEWDHRHFAPERAHVSGSEIYLSLPFGMSKTKLAPALSRIDSVTLGTTRNWRTVVALAERAGR